MKDIDSGKLHLPKIDSDNDDERISAILIPDEPFDFDEGEYIELPEASLETLTRYHKFLADKLPAKLKMTGREDLGYFAWEERFSFDGGSSKEYKALKKQYASCDDKFEFVGLDLLSEEFGLIAKVKRMSDQKIFMIPLVDLVTFKEKRKERQLVDDYSSWFVNFGPENI